MRIIDVLTCARKTPWQGCGIGDAIQMMPVAAAVAAANPKDLVRLVVRDWLLDWGRLGYPHMADYEKSRRLPPPDVELWPHHDVLTTDLRCMAEHTNRQALWAGNLGLKPVPVTPTISAAVQAKADEAIAGCRKPGQKLVWLAPYAANPTRIWARRRWMELAQTLLDDGYAVAGMQSHWDAPCVRWFPGPVFQPDDQAEYSAALLRRGSLFIGNDSGLTHLCGWMNVPSIALCGLTTGSVVFGCYPSVVPIDAAMPCHGCISRKELGWREWCQLSRDALDAIQVPEVMVIARGLLAKG